MPDARPGREQQEQPRVAARADRVALAGVEVGDQPGAALFSAADGGDLGLAGDDDDVGALVYLVLLELLARRQVDHDRARLSVGAQHLRLVGLDRECAYVPGFHVSPPLVDRGLVIVVSRRWRRGRAARVTTRPRVLRARPGSAPRPRLPAGLSPESRPKTRGRQRR